MRDRWYGDQRDLVKWGVLFRLANAYGAGKILQVAYYRPNTWGSLEIDGQQYEVPGEVIAHFRDFRNIMDMRTPAQIDVIGIPFGRVNRRRYTRGIIEAVKSYGSNRCIVFLDPDTGLAPSGSAAGRQHVSESELAAIWAGMRSDDILVLYQHQTNRKGQPWVPTKRAQLADALSLARGEVKLAQGTTIAPDVAFFYCQKSAGHSPTGAKGIAR